MTPKQGDNVFAPTSVCALFAAMTLSSAALAQAASGPPAESLALLVIYSRSGSAAVRVRDEAILRGLVSRDIPIDRVQLVAIGEPEPAVSIPEGVAEERDRRVATTWR